jgi:hypothetical protein
MRTLPKIKLDQSKAYGWGYFTYQVGALYQIKEEKNSQLHLYVMRLNFANSWEHSMNAAIKVAINRSNEYWAALPYFAVPLKTSYFGDRRGMGFVGYAYKQGWHPFLKPLLIMQALEQIELDLHGKVRVLVKNEIISKW